MYVCLCMGVCDREIREAINEGACSVSEVMECTGAGTRCGSCQPTIAQLVGDGDVASSSPRRLAMAPVSSAA
ncbi:(2Fe-2S)-binding protein [Sorangium cellulosum]|uniref:Bacterioferritin-associated ferredoxin n=1 Tax=Sorangium cellulosum TaxID=56 RepID=A0A4P2PX29_SORCE|nr:(2Fe-2S)-binding protein [Sorangium cellulosum]AUX21033.1 (2Fe-2S)-binding protein [Sorangium cellulosum]